MHCLRLGSSCEGEEHFGSDASCTTRTIDAHASQLVNHCFGTRTLHEWHALDGVGLIGLSICWINLSNGAPCDLPYFH